MHGDGVGIGDIVDVQGGAGGAGVIGACPVLLTVTLTCRYMAQGANMITPMTGTRHRQNLQLLPQKQQRRGSKMRDRDNEYYLYG